MHAPEPKWLPSEARGGIKTRLILQDQSFTGDKKIMRRNPTGQDLSHHFPTGNVLGTVGDRAVFPVMIDHHDNATVTVINHTGHKSPRDPRPLSHLHHSFQLTKSPLLNTNAALSPPSTRFVNFRNAMNTSVDSLSLSRLYILFSPPPHSFFYIPPLLLE